MKAIKIISLFLLVSIGSHAQITWNMGMNIATSNFGNMHPRISTDASGNPIVLWNGTMGAMFSRWTGTAFTTPVALNPASMPVAGASWMGPDIASHGDTVYVTFKITPEQDTSSHIYIVRSFDGGQNFSMPFQVDHIGDSISRFPALAIDDNGNPVVAFMKFNSSFMDSRWVVTRSDDFGSTFNTDVKVSGWNGSAAVCDCCPGAIVCAGNTSMMLYRDNNNNIRDIWAGLSTDNANTFTAGVPIDQNNWQIFSCQATGPDGVIVGDTLYSVFMSEASGMPLVYYSAAPVNSVTGATAVQITGTSMGLNAQNYPRIASDGTAMGIAWKQSVNGSDQAMLLFTNDVMAGLPATPDTVDLANVTSVDVAISNGKVYVVWEDDASNTVRYRVGTFNSTTNITGAARPAVKVFPAVTTDCITVSNTGDATVMVVNAMGSMVLEKKISGTSQLSLKGVEDGIYFINVVSSSNQITSTKISKIK